MKSRIAIGIAVASFAVLGLTACSSGTSGTSGAGYGGGAATPAESTTPGMSMTPEPGMTPAAGASLKVADTSLGAIVEDGDGKVVYQFDSDTQGSGASSCTGACLANWPPVHAGADAPMLDGITGAVATITGTDGQPQLTLNGWPLYYYAGDANPGDTNGQGVGGVWWVVTAAGEPVRG